MSQRKIIFFIILGILTIGIAIGFTYISNQQQSKKTSTKTITIWITDGTTESYKNIIQGFKKYAPEYKNTEFIIEKQTNDTNRYRNMLLSTFTEWNWPDIFMLKNGEDAILETKIEPIPSTVIDIWDFDKRYDDIFQDLVYSTGSWKEKIKYIKWIPLWFETLWVFYNKKLIREIPKTWDEMDNLYNESSTDGYPTNLWFGPLYTPNMIDILSLWFIKGGITSYLRVNDWKDILAQYIKYVSFWIAKTSNQWSDDISTTVRTLNDTKAWMNEDKTTTLDLFIQWKIAMILWYPSLILELEKSNKRSESSIDTNNILTELIPQGDIQKKQNIGKYAYFGISKYSKNSLASLKFLTYLLTPEAEKFYINEYPYMIPAQIEFFATAKNTSLSEVFKRTKLDSFVPVLKEEISTFDYGIKSQFEKYLRDGMDHSETTDIEIITKNISLEISCEINSLTGWQKNKDCQ